jgi:hypothetical protein
MRWWPFRSAVKQPILLTAAQDLIKYPPSPAHVPVHAVDTLMASQSELVDKVLRVSAFNHDSVRLTEAVLRQYAAYVHLLPASEAAHFAGVGGLFRLGLEMAYYAARGTHSTIFNNGSAIERQQAEPRWRLATLIAALLHGVPGTLGAMTVDCNSHSWQPAAGPLLTWLQQQPVSEYRVHWRPPLHQANGAALMGFVLPHIVSEEIVQQLTEDPRCFAALLETLSGTPVDPAKNPIYKIVSVVHDQLVDKDLRQREVYIQRPQVGVRPELDVLESMRNLIEDKSWLVNTINQRLWFHDGKLYLVSNGLSELRGRMKALGKLDVPGDDTAVMELMQRTKLLVEEPKQTVQPAGVRRALQALELREPSLFVADAGTALESFSVTPGWGSDNKPKSEEKPTGQKEMVADSDAGAKLRACLGPIADVLTGLDTKIAPQRDGDLYFPLSVFTDAGLQVGPLLSKLFNEGILAMPPGETRKLTKIDGIDHVGISKLGARMLWP